MPVKLTVDGTEEGTYVVEAVFIDESDNSVVPNNIAWSLYDSSRNIVNSRNSVVVAVPAATTNILLQGDDLAIIGRDNRRVMRIDYDYDSSLGSGLPGKGEVEFDITDLETYVGALESTITLTVGTNTWITLTEADNYQNEQFGRDAWPTYPVEIRKKLLINAYNWIKRDGNYSISTVTQKLKDAQAELAWWVYSNLSTWQKHETLIASGVTEFKISKFSENLSSMGLPKTVQDLLEDYLSGLGGYFPTQEREVDTNG